MLERNSKTTNQQAVRRKKPALRIFFYLITAVFFGSVAYILFFSSFLKVSRWQIKGLVSTEEAPVENFLKEQLSGKLLGAVERNNFFLFTEDRMENKFLERFPQLRSVDIQKEFPDGLVFEISERKPTLVVCGKNCYIVDEHGLAYENASDNPASVEKFDLVELKDESNREIKKGENIMDEETVMFVSRINSRIYDELNIETEKRIWTPTIVSGDFRSRTVEGWDILFKKEAFPDKITDVLGAVLDEKINASQRKDLSYVDLRIDNKVYYKFQEGTLAEQQRMDSEASSKSSVSAEPAPPKKKDKR